MSDEQQPSKPLTSADCDLRDFAFMPLDVVRLRDSDLVAMESAEAFRAAVMLWCASWHQMPAASLPDDDRVLANLAGYGRVVKEWQKERDGALRGWVKCTDGRLYHPVVAEKATEAWRGKLERQWRTEAARIKKHNQRHNLSLEPIEFETWLLTGRPQGHPLPVPGDTGDLSPGTRSPSPAPVPRETPSKGQGDGEGQGQGQGQPKKKPTASSPAKLPTCPVDDVIDLYHEVLPEMPRAKLKTADRLRAIRKTWAWLFTEPKASDKLPRATTAAEALEWLRGYFGKARDSDFLMGRTPRVGEHANWKCDLDFLLTDKGMKHVIEKT